MTQFKIKDIAATLGGDDATQYRRERALGRIAMNMADHARDNPLQEWTTAFKHATAARLYDRNAVCWSAIFFYQTEILGMSEQVAAYQALVPLDKFKRAIAGVIVREQWTFNIETETYADRPKDCRYAVQVNSDKIPFKSKCSTNRNAIVSRTTVPLNRLLKPVLSRIDA